MDITHPDKTKPLPPTETELLAQMAADLRTIKKHTRIIQAAAILVVVFGLIAALSFGALGVLEYMNPGTLEPVPY